MKKGISSFATWNKTTESFCYHKISQNTHHKKLTLMSTAIIIITDKMISEVVNDKCLMDLVEAEGMTPQQWVVVEMNCLKKRADAYDMSIEQYTNIFWTGEPEDWK
jgi:hypothetical protein